MQPDIIQDILRRGEGLTIEFKQTKSELPKSLFETVCAFVPLMIAKETTKETTKETKKTTKEIGANELLILKIISDNELVSAVELSHKIGLTADGVRYYLNKLKNKGILSRKGPTKGGKWVVLSKKDKR